MPSVRQSAGPGSRIETVVGGAQHFPGRHEDGLMAAPEIWKDLVLPLELDLLVIERRDRRSRDNIQEVCFGELRRRLRRLGLQARAGVAMLKISLLQYIPSWTKPRRRPSYVTSLRLYVVTVASAGEDHGMTATGSCRQGSIADGVVALENTSKTLGMIRDSRHFAVNMPSISA